MKAKMDVKKAHEKEEGEDNVDHQILAEAVLQKYRKRWSEYRGNDENELVVHDVSVRETGR